MNLQEYIIPLQVALESELKRQISRLDKVGIHSFHDILTYHLGWTGEGSGQEAQGKRVRPILLMLSTASCGENWELSLPAAAAVELVHNFSLVHDDIQDNSNIRRGRETVWKMWGMPQGINAGDAMFVLSNLAMLDLIPTYSPEITLKGAKILQGTCLELTCGQFLDMSYETKENPSLEDYWPMVGGKTAALISASCTLGALLGKADESVQDAYQSFGHYLGLSFQIQDDLLGIWGDMDLTGKSTESDLVSGKKSFPILFGLRNNGAFAKRWKKGPILPDEVDEIAETLAKEGARSFTQETADQMTDMAMKFLSVANPKGKAGEALFAFSNDLLSRKA